MRSRARVSPRGLLLVVSTLVALLVCSSVAAASSSPVLGWNHAFPNGAGFGRVKPSHVYLGGDPTGDVTGVHWTGWGGRKPIGHGAGWCPGSSVADGYYCSVSLHLGNLGSCHGRHAYRVIVFYFKLSLRHGWTWGSKWNACTGQAIF